jgi:hypothetical protein
LKDPDTAIQRSGTDQFYQGVEPELGTIAKIMGF